MWRFNKGFYKNILTAILFLFFFFFFFLLTFTYLLLFLNIYSAFIFFVNRLWRLKYILFLLLLLSFDPFCSFKHPNHIKKKKKIIIMGFYYYCCCCCCCCHILLSFYVQMTLASSEQVYEWMLALMMYLLFDFFIQHKTSSTYSNHFIT